MALRQVIDLKKQKLNPEEYLFKISEKAFVVSYDRFVPGRDRLNPSRKIASIEEITEELRHVRKSDQDFSYLKLFHEDRTTEAGGYVIEKITNCWKAAGLVEVGINGNLLVLTEHGENRVPELRKKYSA